MVGMRSHSRPVDGLLIDCMQRSLAKIIPTKAVSQFAVWAAEGTNEKVLDEWYQVIVPDGMNTGVLRVFGAPLHHCISRQMGSRLVPQVLSDTIQFLDEFGVLSPRPSVSEGRS